MNQILEKKIWIVKWIIQLFRGKLLQINEHQRKTKNKGGGKMIGKTKKERKGAKRERKKQTETKKQKKEIERGKRERKRKRSKQRERKK